MSKKPAILYTKQSFIIKTGIFKFSNNFKKSKVEGISKLPSLDGKMELDFLEAHVDISMLRLL